MENIKIPTIFKATAYMLFAIMSVYVVIIAKGFLWPLALALLFAYLLYPFANYFEKRLHFPRILSNLTVLIIAIVLLAMFLFFMYKQLAMLVSDFETIKIKAMANMQSVAHSLEESLGIDAAQQKFYLGQVVDKVFESAGAIAGLFVSSASSTLGSFVIMPIYIFFMLYYRDKFYDFIFMAAKGHNTEKVEKVITDVSSVAKNYVGGVFVVVSILCFTNSFGLWLIGMDYFIILGVVSAICNFIPYFGTPLGFAFPLVFAIFTGDSPNLALGVVAVFSVVQFTENNILTPSIVGGNLRLNPIVIILSLIVGAMIWGIPGMLVIVPFMAVMRIVFEHEERFKAFAFLLGDQGTEKHAVTFDKIKSIFGKK